MNTILKFILLVFTLLTGIALLAAYLTFYNPLPNYTKDIRLEGVQDKVTIHRDKYGVPHMFASSKEDVYFALGYVHAQDRIWQMTLSQLTAEGRFSEFLGEDFIEADKFLRILGFHRTAEKIWQELPEDQKNILEHYAAGVNSFTARNKKRLPIEFAITGMGTMTWKPQHTIALSRIMAWEMNTSWRSKTVTGYLQELLEPRDFEELFFHLPNTAFAALETTQSTGGSLPGFIALETQMNRLLGNKGSGSGSNAWVAGGSVTESGYPLLAGDPHLGMAMPGTWFEVHLNVNGRNASGVTIPGAPAIVIGQNDFMAWSLTNVMADDTDFFVEKLHPGDQTRYLADSSGNEPVYEKLEIERDIIKVKDGDEILQEIRFTQNGPVISDIPHETGLSGGRMFSMRWTGHETSNELGVLMDINWAGSFGEFQNALPEFKVPGMNIIYGDRSGNIAMYVMGSFPQRKNPLSFRRGWLREDDWQGYIPFRQLPHIVNPESGLIANANYRLHDDDYPYYISAFQSSPSRTQRIESMLQDQEALNPEYYMTMQNDIFSPHARDVTRLILPVLAEAQSDRQIGSAISYLKNWDFNYATNAAAASILDVFFMKLSENTIKKNIGEEAYHAFTSLEFLPVNALNHLLKESLSDTSADAGKFHISHDNILNSMKDAMNFLEDSLGTQSYEWRWENLHTLTLKPPLFDQAAGKQATGKATKLIVKNILGRGPYPVPGHGMTINKGQYKWGEPFKMTLGATQRRVADLSDLKKSYSVLSTGQSGNPISRHYDDQLPLWLDGRYRIFYHHQDEIENFSNATMTIKPR